MSNGAESMEVPFFIKPRIETGRWALENSAVALDARDENFPGRKVVRLEDLLADHQQKRVIRPKQVLEQ